jgi:hypothetical protein
MEKSVMNSKTVALFLSLGLVTTLTACGGANSGGGEEGGATLPSPSPSSQGGEGGALSVLPPQSSGLKTAQAETVQNSTFPLLASGSEQGESGESGESSESNEHDERDESDESDKSGEHDESDESGESGESGEQETHSLS